MSVDMLATCTRKKPYSEREARATAAFMAGRGKKVIAFRCWRRDCEPHWHVGRGKRR